MYKNIASILFLLNFFLPQKLLAETIILKSGQKIEGKILERTETFIKLDVRGVLVQYFFDEISNIKAEMPKPQFSTIKLTFRAEAKLFDKEGHVVYKNQTEETNYIDMNLNKSRSETKETAQWGGQEHVDQKINIFDGKNFLVIDLGTKRGHSMDIFGDTDSSALGNLLIYGLNEKDFIGTEKLLGRECKVYKFSTGTKIHVWNNIILREEEQNDKGSSLKEVISIEENIPIDEKLFAIPEGVEIKDVDEAIIDSFKIDETTNILERLPPELVNEGYINPEAQKMVVDALEKDFTLSKEQKEETIRRYKEIAALMKDDKTTEDKQKWIKDAKMTYTEATFGTVHLIFTIFTNYHEKNGAYPEKLQMIGPEESLGGSGIINRVIDGETMFGYQIIYKWLDKDHFEILAKPVLPDLKPIFVDETGVIRFEGKMGPIVDPEMADQGI